MASSFLQRLEDFTYEVSKPLRPYVPVLARFLLVVTFLEDALRLAFQWENQMTFFQHKGYPGVAAAVYLLANIAAQLIGSVLIVAKRNVDVGVGILVADITMQAIIYGLFTSFSFVLRVLSVCGGLLLVLADALNAQKTRSVFAGLPQLDQATRSTYLQLAGRVLLVCLCLSIMVGGGTFELNLGRIMLITVGMVMCAMVILGFKAKITAVVLLVGLSFANIVVNSFWQFESSAHSSRDVVQYDFFQTLSVLGGFLLLAQHGPGDLSLDERKKTM